MPDNLKFKRIVTYIILTIVLLIGYYWLREVPWKGDKQLHTLMEVVATILAFFVGVMALIRFYSKKDNSFLFIGTGFLGTSFLDGYHAIVTSTFFDYLFPSPPPSLIPWSWTASRIFLAILLWLSYLAWKREDKLGPVGRISEKTVYIGVSLLTFASFIFFVFWPLPRAYYPELFFHRPEELVPAFFFLMALIGHLKKGLWQSNNFEHWLILSLIVNFIAQMMFVSFSGHLFDTMFDAAHLLKKASYLCVLTGLLINMYLLFSRLEREIRVQSEELTITNEELQTQSEELTATNEELQVQTKKLELELTYRQQVQERLKESEERFALAMKGASDGLWDWNLITNEVYLSPRWKGILGYTDDEVQNKLETFQQLTFPEDLEKITQKMNDYFEQKIDKYEHTFRMQHKAGHLIWILTRGTAVRDNQGKPVRLIGTHVDITKQKQIQDQLKESEERFALAMKGASDGLWDWDLVTKELYLSPRWKELLGYQDKELVNHVDTYVALVLPEDLEKTMKSVEDYLEQRIDTYEHVIRMKHKEGHLVWILTRGIAIRDEKNKPVRLVGTHVDISKQKQAELELQQKQARLEESQQVAHLGNWEWNIHTNEVFWSDEVFRIFGVEPYEFEPNYEKYLSFIYPEDRQLVQEAIAQALEKVPYEIDHRIILPSGEIRYVHEQGEVFFNETDKPQRMLGIVQDITERKKMEKELRLAQFVIENAPEVVEWITPEGKLSYINQAECDDLGYTREELLTMSIPDIDPNFPQEQWCNIWKQVKQDKSFLLETTHQRKDGSLFPVEVTGWYLNFDDKEYLCTFIRNITERKHNEQALIQAKEKADAANHAKSVFLANMSHELRTPLNAILGYTQLLKQNSALTAELQKDIHVIHRNGQYLLTLINDILDLSKLEAQHIELYPTEIRLSQFIKNVSELFIERAKQKGIAFNFKPLSQLPIGIHVDERRLRQILVNLLGNAVKFTQEGGVTFKIDYQQGNLLFWIEDTGVGISQENVNKIFEPFHQIGDHFTAKSEGTGLGLSITLKLVKMMQGKLTVESQLGQGSVFQLILPLPEASNLLQVKEEVLPVITGFEGKPRKILVVDDKKENRAVLTSLLTPLGFAIIEAENGNVGLVQLKRLNPDLVITDLVMPIMDGFTFTREIRKSEIYQNIPIIAVSASIFEHSQVVTKAGCDKLMTKPFRFEELLETIGHLLNLHWIYSTIHESLMSATQPMLLTEIPLETLDWHLIPSEHLATLFDLSMKGDVCALTEEADILEKMDKNLQPVTEKIRSLSNSFDTEAICELIEPHLPPPIPESEDYA